MQISVSRGCGKSLNDKVSVMAKRRLVLSAVVYTTGIFPSTENLFSVVDEPDELFLSVGWLQAIVEIKAAAMINLFIWQI